MKRSEDLGGIDPKKVPWWTSARLALAMVGFLGFVNMYALRVDMSVAMVCMVNNTAQPGDVNATNVTVTVAENQCQRDPTVSNSTNTTDSQVGSGEFNWDKETQGIVLGSFFWGYLVTQIPGGWLSARFGGKRVFGWFMLMTAVASLLTPVGARGHLVILIILRIIKGIGSGVVYPAMHALWSIWAPPLERSKLISFTYAGAQVGSVIAFPVTGLLCQYGFDGGWPSVFYVFGGIGVLWFALWMFFVADSPAQHRRITDIEKRYIEKSIGATRSTNKKQFSTPWKKIFTSKAMWAIIVGHTASNWGTYTMLTNTPTYMKEVLKFDIRANGALSAVPFLSFWAFIVVGGFLADYIRTRGVRTKVVRVIFTIGGSFIPGALLIGTGYVDCRNPFLAVVLLSLGLGFSGFQYPGVIVNHVDIAPPFAGIMFGISNTFATIPGFVAPYVIARITQDQTQEQWQMVFYVAAGVYAVGAIVFMVFCKGEIEDWVKPYMYDDDEEKIALSVEKDTKNGLKQGEKI